jgi:CRP-like cAMP-binding protein
MKAGEKPDIRKVKQGKVLVEQGKPGNELFLLLDGVLAAEVDGVALAELGPGALLGERAVIEGGLRTATLRAVTKCTVACAPADRIDKAVLAEVAEGHRREDQQA